jgi:UDP-N-acetylmuramoylalanine--D-glutamate ligase
MANYAAVKETVFAHLPASGTAIVGAVDAFCDAVAERVAARRLNVLRISCRSRVSNGVCLTGAALTEMVDGRIRNRASLDGIGSLRGAHNAQNAAAAMTAASSLGVSWDVLSAALRSFPGLPHRMEEVRRIGNVLFINDSKATNADAAERALASFSNIYWIAGGKPKEGGIASLAPYFGRIRRVYLIGEAAAAFEATLDGKVAAVRSGTLDKAVAQAAADAAGDETEAAVVLLSPACASYDQFRNFEVRGDAFRKLVAALPSQAAQDRAA